MNLKLRINLIITTLLFFTLIIGGGIFTIQNARGNVQAEIASTAILALHMLDAEILYYSTSNTSRMTKENAADGSIFELKKLADVRHLKIDLYDRYGALIDTNQIHSPRENAPSWFFNLLDTVTGEMPVTHRAVFNNRQIVGELVITPDPSYEILEVWEEINGMAIFIGIFFIVVNFLIYYFVGHALRPIDKILSALTEIELGNLKSRLPQFNLPELTRISNKFNVMADTLESSIASNHHLSQQLIQIQEDERKNLARELHDEIGQHLTAIHVDASVIIKAKTVESTKESAAAIDTVSRQMMDIIHNILQRLRPTGLDELGLEASLQELINGWQLRSKDIIINRYIDGSFQNLNEALLITIYRLTQECLTNIARHANATAIDIKLIQNPKSILLSIQDNGDGFNLSKKPTGFGLAGMQERVEALSGNFNIETTINEGTTIMINLPYVLEDSI